MVSEMMFGGDQTLAPDTIARSRSLAPSWNVFKREDIYSFSISSHW